ncbi:hypothetical protein [Bacillus bombysepticus]|uniref:hypothetical protein n=1 Tax=Bacillus bombysepticus TaxID=658666 RepID=UPI0030173EB3
MQEITKTYLLELLKKTEDDAIYHCRKYLYDNHGSTIDYKLPKKTVLKYIENIEEVYWRDVFLVEADADVYIQIDYFFDNVHYKTKDITEFKEIKCSYNKYFNIYYKINKIENTITYKLGDKMKTLKIVNENDQETNPATCVVEGIPISEHLERHLQDSSSVRSNISIGRKILGIPVI